MAEWVNQYKRDRSSLEDNLREEEKKPAKTGEKRVWQIIYKELVMGKLCDTWVTYWLNISQK